MGLFEEALVHLAKGSLAQRPEMNLIMKLMVTMILKIMMVRMMTMMLMILLDKHQIISVNFHEILNGTTASSKLIVRVQLRHYQSWNTIILTLDLIIIIIFVLEKKSELHYFQNNNLPLLVLSRLPALSLFRIRPILRNNFAFCILQLKPILRKSVFSQNTNTNMAYPEKCPFTIYKYK